MLAAEAVVEDPPYIRGARVGTIDVAGFVFLALWLGTLQIILDRGEQEDWFAAEWIRWFAAVSVVSFAAFLVRQFRAAHPLVDLRVLRHRNFSAGLVLITMLGGVLYGTTAALPIFLQTLMGYPALQSGLVLSPRGVGAFFTTLLVGRLVGKIAGRWLVFTGFALLSVSSFWLGRINLQISEANAIMPVILSGIAISFVFVPLTTTAMGGLRQDQMGNATGVYNLMRNLGGSFGIAMVTTFLARHAQMVQASLVRHLTPYDPAYTERVAALTAALAPSGGVSASQQATALVGQTVWQQAQLAAFVFNFRLFGVLCLCCLPAVFLFQRVRAMGSVPAGH